tara:strand:+ start:15177 stop:15473 length:297 start_codon:yes stop_codon:yes gene_type:complete
MDIERENRKCMNTFTLPSIETSRKQKHELPDRHPMLQKKSIKNAGKEKEIKEVDVFDYGAKKITKIKKKVQFKPKLDYLFDSEEPIDNKKKPKLNKNY